MDHQQNNSILIMGTGAMACLFAARLSAAGTAVTLFGTWTEGLEALRQHGVRVVEAERTPVAPEHERAYPVQATDNLRDCRGARYALVLVKSWQTNRAADQLARCLTKDGLALTLQNGAGNYELLADVLGTHRVVLGSTTVGATLLSPGRVRPAGEGVISLGAHPSLAPLAARLRAAGFVIENVHDANALLWGKLIINAAINPLTALLGFTNGELLQSPSARALMSAVAREAAAVAVAQGISLPYPDPVVAAENIAQRTAENRSSMLRDVLRHAPTEIDAINGAIVQAGEQTGVPTPINRTLWQLVRALTEA
ncbi:MAG: 2-dehydropantoate 2-reductase [Anaerolineales bacterium]|nr:2-dehydropantoate 2-reductase [Anaerolineales bacterium]